MDAEPTHRHSRVLQSSTYMFVIATIIVYTTLYEFIISINGTKSEVQGPSIPFTSEHVGLLFATYTCMWFSF